MSTWAGTPDRPQQARPSAFELGAVLLHEQVDGQNPKKAKIARYTGCEHNRDAVRTDP